MVDKLTGKINKDAQKLKLPPINNEEEKLIEEEEKKWLEESDKKDIEEAKEVMKKW